jgi:glucan endo-1,3-alpha-glucosidase
MIMRRQTWLELVWVVLLFLVFSPGEMRAAGPHYVFAHYMVCYADYGDSVDGFKRDILEAQAAGIDGFALNCGEWNRPDAAWFYTNRVEMMYKAAEQLGTGFKLFFSVDDSDANEIVAMISSHANRANSFRYQDKLVVSTFAANNVDWQNSVFLPLKKAGIDVFFVPYFAPPGGEPWNSISNVLAKYNFLDGLFYFAAGTASDITNRNQAYSRACKNAGKLFMGGYSPNYWGCRWPKNSGRPYYETQGGEGTVAQWMWIIANQPDWVEITTWNDFNESTYILPVDDPGRYTNAQTPHRYSHAGYLELSKRYISWYKTGQEPPISQDALFYFYRIHSTNAVAGDTNDFPVHLWPNNGDVQDVIYATVFLTAPAQLEIISGKTLTTNSLPAGMSHVRTPFMPGAQIFAVKRNGTMVLFAQGPDILSQIKNYDYFPASGYVYGKPMPPAVDRP